jgi:hypothetical protein
MRGSLELMPLLMLGILIGCTSTVDDAHSDRVLAVLATPADTGAPAGVVEERDSAVVEVVLLKLLDDPEFRWQRSGGTSTIVLGVRAPGKVGFVAHDQMAADLWRKHEVPEDLEGDLMRRNQAAGTWDSLPISFGSSKFDSRIVVADLDEIWKRPGYSQFEKAFPEARCWAAAWLPSYSADGLHALLRLAVGPTPHGATITAWLAKNRNAWQVEWLSFAYYA